MLPQTSNIPSPLKGSYFETLLLHILACQKTQRARADDCDFQCHVLAQAVVSVPLGIVANRGRFLLYTVNTPRFCPLFGRRIVVSPTSFDLTAKSRLAVELKIVLDFLDD